MPSGCARILTSSISITTFRAAFAAGKEPLGPGWPGCESMAYIARANELSQDQHASKTRPKRSALKDTIPFRSAS
jgi:hypothetical protein